MASAGINGFYAGARTFQWVTDNYGLPIDQVNFLICQFAALFVSILYRKALPPIKTPPEVRHGTAMVVGICFGYFCFGYQISHLFVLSMLTYIIMNTVSPHIMQRVVMFVALLYLSSMHLLRLKFDYGGWTVDITGPLMIAVQKLSSLAFSVHDGLTGDDKLSSEQKKYVVRKVPTMLEFFSYMFNFETLMCGPLVFYNDYEEFVTGANFIKHHISNESISSKLDKEDALPLNSFPSPTVSIIKKLFVSIFFAVLLVTIVPLFPISYITEDAFLYETPWYSKLLYIYVATSVSRTKYYHAWLLGESICNSAGLGFNGYTSDSKTVAKWDLISNIDIIRFECSFNLKETLEAWNKSTQRWLRMVCYDRAPTHKTFLTYLLSAAWHGFYPGYYLTFLGGAMFTIAARTVRRSVRPLFQKSWAMARLYDVITFITTRISLAYICFPFIILEFLPSIRVYRSFYFLGHLMPLAAISLLPIAFSQKSENRSSNKGPKTSSESKTSPSSVPTTA